MAEPIDALHSSFAPGKNTEAAESAGKTHLDAIIVPDAEPLAEEQPAEQGDIAEHFDELMPAEPPGDSSTAQLINAAGPKTSSAVLDDLVPLPIPLPVDVTDLDWAAIEARALAPDGPKRISEIVQSLENLLADAHGSLLLFDRDRSDPEDRAIKVSSEPPLWIIGDLHGDLLALEAALALIRRETEASGEEAGIVFLGDLIDDGGSGLALLLRVFDLILGAPHRVCLIAGNHDEALSFEDGRFTSSVDPSDFAQFLNEHIDDEWMVRAGRLAIHLFANAPRALFFPGGLLAAHGGFPLIDLHARLSETQDWNDPQVLEDFVWTRAHPRARKKLPNRYSRGSQFGYQDFAAFCELSKNLGRPVSHLVRGHDHVDDRFAIYGADRPNPILTTIALSHRLERESGGTYGRVPTIARFVAGAFPQVYRLHIPPASVQAVYPEHVASNQEERTP